VKKYQHSTLVRAPQGDVARFHSNSEALKLLTPPPILVTFNHIDPIGDNSQTDFTMWFGPFPIKWIAIHQKVDLPNTFTDFQKKGPFDFWRHKHTFKSIDKNSTMIVDEVEYLPGSRLINGIVTRILGLTLPILFAYRGWVIRRNLEIGISG
jgi:ligand-binding SRPBCC domain-containing protein